jgi:hypothetical protein
MLTKWWHCSQKFLIFLCNHPDFQCIWFSGPQVFWFHQEKVFHNGERTNIRYKMNSNIKKHSLNQKWVTMKRWNEIWTFRFSWQWDFWTWSSGLWHHFVGGYWHFRGMCYLYLLGRWMQHMLLEYPVTTYRMTVSHARRPKSEGTKKVKFVQDNIT